MNNGSTGRARELPGPYLSPQQCVVRYQLEKWARERPDATFVVFEDGPVWTFAEALEIARATASGLASIGVKPQEPLLLWLPTSPEYVSIMLGAQYLGAIVASPNTAYRGAVLQHIVTQTGAAVAVVHGKLLDRFESINHDGIRKIILCGEIRDTTMTDKIVDINGIIDHDIDESISDVVVDPWDIQYITYTSGTTGPSKGVTVTYVETFTYIEQILGGWYGPEDKWLVQLPMYHLSGTLPFAAALAFGAGVILARPFRVEVFWDTVDRLRPTFAVLLGSMVGLLQDAAGSSAAAVNSLRRILVVPYTEEVPAFAARFGVKAATWYGSTELPAAIISGWGPADAASCGKLAQLFEARIVDENDIEVADGTSGELIVRSARPWAITPGYWRDPGATAKAWRNGWYHTGDRFRRSIDGDYYFLGRLKDAIRRRGENISAFEVERDVALHPDVAEVAAIGVVNPSGEGDVLIAVVRASGSTLQAPGLFEFLVPKMAYFMLPRYIRFLPELPRTDTGRVQKYRLADEGVTADSWDREAAGIRVKREQF